MTLKPLKKIAQDIPRRSRTTVPAATPAPTTGIPSRTKPTTTTTAPAASFTPGTARVAPVGPALPVVKEMQVAMQELADAVMRDTHSAIMPVKPKDVVHHAASPEVDTAKKGFNDFIAEQYIGALPAEHKGAEWSAQKEVTTQPEKQKSTTDIYELDAVMDTLRRIGTGSQEFKADGSWDFRTNNALRNIMGFARALLNLEKDFSLPGTQKFYSDQMWQNLQKLLSDYKDVSELTSDQKASKALVITTHLKAITKLYNHFRNQVLARPELRPLLEGKRAFETYDVAQTKQEQSLIEQNAAIEVEYQAPKMPGGKATSIPLKALTGKAAFEEYLKQVGWTDENLKGDMPVKLLATIKRQLGS